jgi:metal-sulfur cluster biosynthetic enzyme
MSDETKDALNPHTGQPWPADPAPPAASGAPATEPPASDSSAPKAAGPANWSGTPSQRDLAVRAALETVMDPEIQLSVIDLGLIREIVFHEHKTIVRMMLTTPFCPYAPQMMADVKNATESAVPQPCEVDLLPDPWSPEMMPDPSLLGYSF